MSYRKHHINPKIKSFKRKKLKKKLIVYFSLSFLSITAVAYIIFFAPQFKITNFEILGNQNIDKNNIESFLSKNISPRIFFLNSDLLAKKTLVKFPLIETVNIKRKFPDTVVIDLKERMPIAAFCAKDCFLIDGSGVIFEKLSSIPKDDLLINGEADKEFNLGDKAADENIIEGILKVRDSLKNNFQIKVKEVLIGEPLIFTTYEGWKIYFNPGMDINFQIARMNLLLKNEITTSIRKRLRYIYLQYKDRAYYLAE